MASVIGWDIGGVHLKGARAEGGRIVAAVQIVAHLGYGLDRLEQAFAEAKSRLGPAASHAITMTGELADIFASRAEGVAALARIAATALTPARLSFYAGRAGFVAAEAVDRHAADIASANWHASAAVVARGCADALFVDMGSTTTDIVPVAGGRIAARGYTDAERLAAGELVYTGLIRSHVPAVAQQAPVAGVGTPLMNEIFADMGDVYRLLGRLDPAIDQQVTADGADKSKAASQTRLGRMIACDRDALDDPAWRNLARWFAEQQLRRVHDATMLVLSAVALPESAPLVTAGIGSDVLGELARRMGRPYIAFDTFLPTGADAAAPVSHFAPAAAVALLAAAREPGAGPIAQASGGSPPDEP